MITRNSGIFACALEQAAAIAEMAGLRKIKGPGRHDDQGGWGNSDTYHAWEDRAHAGAGCRITWKNGIAWVSRHSGNANWDLTEEVCYFFREVFNLREVESQAWLANPRIHGEDQSDEWFAAHPHYADGGD